MKPIGKTVFPRMLVCFLLVAVSTLGLPIASTYAQETNYRSFRTQLQWSDEGGDINEDDVREWRQRSRRIQNAINNLGDDEVENLPIPILFGVTQTALTRNFGDVRGGGSRTHEGLDIMAPEGTPIVTPTEAVVIRVGTGANSGNYVSTANPGGETFVYMHLERPSDIEEGDTLKVGDVIGYVGNTGNASGGAAHLHFEIREDRVAKDPFPRLTREFSLEQKIEFLDSVLEDVADEEAFSEFLVRNYSSTFLQAKAQGIDLPEEIEEVLPQSSGASQSPSIPTNNLSIGSRGVEVSNLQQLLINQGYLDIGVPTGYFGPLTQSALINYQRARGIPETGIYDATTRTALGQGSLIPQNEEELRAQLIAQIAQLTALVLELQAQLARMQ